MGRKRQDRTKEEWSNHGIILLDMMSKKHKLFKKIDAALSKLQNDSDEINKQEITKSLNSHKDILGGIWLKWVKKISQKPKDENRTKFYIKNNTYNEILSFVGLDEETKKIRKISDKKVFATLFQHFNSFGVNNTDEMYNLIDELNKFGSSTSELHSKDSLTDKNKGYQGKTNKIIHAILAELKRQRITNYEKLISLRSDTKRELRDSVYKSLSEENKVLKQKVRQLEDELHPPLDLD
jgi:hypothetical protein